jgi:hypothetical protein
MRKTVYSKFKSPMKSRSTSKQTTLNHLVYIRTLTPELIVVCGLVATVRVCRTVGCWFDPHRLGFCRKFASLPQLLKYFFPHFTMENVSPYVQRLLIRSTMLLLQMPLGAFADLSNCMRDILGEGHMKR